MAKPSFLVKRFGVAAVAAGLCLAVGVGGAFAYYTDTTSARGTVPIVLGTPTTDIDEGDDPAIKNIVITSTGDAPAAVRVKLFWNETEATVNVDLGDGWVEKDGWYYYTQPLWSKGDATTVLKATAQGIAKEDASESTLSDQFDVAVVQQCAALAWDDQAKGLKADFAGTPFYLYDAMAIEPTETEGE